MRGWEGRSGADGRGLSRGGTGGAYAAGGLARNLLYLGGTCHGQRRGASTRLNRGWSGAWQGCQGLAFPGGNARPFFQGFRAVSRPCRKKSAPGGSWNRGNPGDLVPGAEQAVCLGCIASQSDAERHSGAKNAPPGGAVQWPGGLRRLVPATFSPKL